MSEIDAAGCRPVTLLEHVYAIYSDLYSCKNDNFQMIFFIFISLNIDCGYILENEAVLTSIHNVCFRAKIRKFIPL